MSPGREGSHRRLMPFYKEVGGLAVRPREQFWISTALESSAHRGNGNHMQDVRHLFNWTAASGKNATFQFGTFLIRKRERKRPFEEVEREVKLHLASKNKLVCWAVSNCGFVFTDRITPAKDLAKNLKEKLHLYGRSCIKGMNDHVEDHGKLKGTWTKDVRRTIDECIFYLAYENSNCTEYVTEKFSNALISYAIPIVNGFKESYEKRLPGSYIYYKDFQGGKELSDYLEYLRGNWTAYMEYHKWRQYYTVHDIEEAQDELYCDICKRLKVEKESGYKKTYIIPDVPEFYARMQTCIR
ncbi:4-galactosyl-N-acetylglucosaminide 3-alpha-L-fucosyltransferase 9-like isoform X2 [Convolutriloba macropyga]|uniref:4-galactosyl-N-acetylglucosaminide 3-alpha-L-fucosyltransferase 9-like isoform X2 n=1 Tax=Convolutriloba macropyga TaxID=536237 RepID=UPI003F51BD93